MEKLRHKGLMSVREAAEALGLKEAALRQWVSLRQIEFVRVGRLIRIKPETIEQLIEINTVPALQDRK